MNPNHIRIVRVNVADVLDWFTYAARWWPGYVSLPVIDGVPKEAKVIGVREDHRLRVFEFTVWHESFAAVPLGEMPPVLENTVHRLVTIAAQPVHVSYDPADKASLSAAIRQTHDQFNTLPTVAVTVVGLTVPAKTKEPT